MKDGTRRTTDDRRKEYEGRRMKVGRKTEERRKEDRGRKEGRKEDRGSKEGWKKGTYR